MACTDPWVLENQLRERLAEAEDYAQEAQPESRKVEDLEREILKMQVQIQSFQLQELTDSVEREKNPAVKDAWEKYQTVLKLTRKS